MTESKVRPLVVYVAGPYRGATTEDIEVNIAAARGTAIQTVHKGWMPLCPHTNTGLMDVENFDISDEFWLDGTMELMRRCDAVVLVEGWESSLGTRAEIQHAMEIGLPVFPSISVLPFANDWLAKRTRQFHERR